MLPMLSNDQSPPGQSSGPLISAQTARSHGLVSRSTPLEMPTEVTARLEWLDDVMFAAIAGDARALDMAATAWHDVLADLGADAVEESRRQYLRRAQSVWNDLRQQPHRAPHHVFAAIEVISLLVGKAH